MPSLKRNGIVYSLILAASLSSTSADAGIFFEKGPELVELARQYDRFQAGERETTVLATGRFMAFVSGVHDTLNGLLAVCTPENATLGQACAIVSKYLKEHPDEWDKPAVILVSKALKQAFPCNK